MFCIFLANQIQVIQRQPFFNRQPSIITFYRLKKIPKNFFSSKIKIRLIVRHEKEKNHFQVRQKKESIIMKKTILDRNNFFIREKIF